jgi:hypothetical protein
LRSKIKKYDPKDEILPCAVFDSFLQAFIVTRNDYSFYMDLNGVYDFDFRKIVWSNKVKQVQLASPYIVAFLSNSNIEVRNIFNPLRIFQKIELDSCKLISTSIAYNLQKRHQGRLDDFNIIIMSTDEDNLSEVLTLIKFKQERAETQLSLWHNLKLYSTSLKFVDYL